LFGLVLAIGLVVDDAIVVVEAVQRHIEEGLAPKEAAFKAMEEVSAPVIGIAIILAAVFVPTVFVPGITGRLYQQFAVTVAISVLISAFNALTLSPALSALLLRHKRETRGPLSAFFRLFNRAFERGRNGYVATCAALIRKSVIAVAMLAGCALAAGWFGTRIPTGFLPEEDQGYFLLSIQLPNAASLQRTDVVIRKIEDVVKALPAVETYTSVSGVNFLSGVPNTYSGAFFIKLKPWDERKSNEDQATELVRLLNRRLGTLPEGIAFSITPPAIPGVGASGGFTFILEDRSGKDLAFPGREPAALPAGGPKAPGAEQPEHHAVAHHSASIHRCGPGQNDCARRGSQRPLPDAAGLHGRSLCQLLQPIRPPMAGFHRGGRRAANARGERRPVSMCATTRAAWCPFPR